MDPDEKVAELKLQDATAPQDGGAMRLDHLLMIQCWLVSLKGFSMSGKLLDEVAQEIEGVGRRPYSCYGSNDWTSTTELHSL